jgi:hypothetical protein
VLTILRASTTILPVVLVSRSLYISSASSRRNKVYLLLESLPQRIA